jgi:hypothetical protein
MGWLRQSNFREKDEDDRDWLAKQAVARKLAHLVLVSQTVVYKQWFQGEDNVVTDSLSTDLFFFIPISSQIFLTLHCLSSAPP